MAVNTETLQSIQRAGSALRDAHHLLAQEVSQQARQVSEAMSSDPFNIASDEQFESWKTVARMARSIAAMEEQLKGVYFAAADLHGGRTLSQPLALGFETPSDRVIDAEASKPSVPRARKVSKAAGPAKVADAPQKSARPLRGNAAAALAFFKTRLNHTEFQRVTHPEVVSGASIALGSVGFAIASLKSRGLLEEGGRGEYRLMG